MLRTPRALLLDFGGVIADGPDSPTWSAELVDAVSEVLAAEGVPPLAPEAILDPLADDGQRNVEPFWVAQAPTQPDHVTMWSDVIGAGWPPDARAAVAAHAATLSRRLMEVRHAGSWQLRPGMVGLLADADERGLPMAVVSNTLSGAPQREFLDRVGVAHRFTVQLYSDEEGVRKPNPELAWRAVAALEVEAADCWFVGDTISRDVLVARRAGLGAAILMRSLRVEPSPRPSGVTPDAVVEDPGELHRLLDAHW